MKFSLALLAVGLLYGQTASFEVASIKPVKADGGPLRVSMASTPGRIDFSNVTLMACVRRAYGLKPYQVTGGPDWIRSDRFNVSAEAAEPVSEERLMRMLQSLLVERFQLEFRRESREMPVYSLVAAKSGIKLTPSKSAESEVDGGDGELRVRGSSPAMIASLLSRHLDRPVLDRTGLSGAFDFSLKFAPESGGNEPAAGPSIFTALQEQLGLRLEAAKGPVEILVVTGAGKPSEN